MKYSAINIGPILATFGMARKPREMWAASYLFSYLMKYIINVLPNDKIISPAIIKESSENTESEKKEEPLGTGLYPDRIFIKGDVKYDTIKSAIDTFAEKLSINVDYFNVMLTSKDCNSDAEAIKDLNEKLDCMELFNLTSPQNAKDKVRELIIKTYGSPLFADAFGKMEFPVESLGEIAAVEFKDQYPNQWAKFKGAIRNKDSKIAEKAYNELPKEKLKSYHKYICIVQADGDNMGATVTHSALPEGKVKEISEALLKFGEDATKAIKDFGGLPIYAGGDDLLFIAPVVGKNQKQIIVKGIDGKEKTILVQKNIIDLLNDIDNKFVTVRETAKVYDKEQGKDVFLKKKEKNGKEIELIPTMSYGVSVSYYKYPLYEAHNAAIGLLFDTAKKEVDHKNAIALDLRKHSGGTVGMAFSRYHIELSKAFDEMITASKVDESVISAIAHKIRENEGLFDLWIGKLDTRKEEEIKKLEARNGNFFQKFIERDPDKKENVKNDSDRYKDAALNLMNKISKLPDMTAEKLTQTLYGMLRIAKFINGEEVRDE